jgi:hypothetical protein
MNRLIEIAAAALASGSAAHRVGVVAQRGVAGIACAGLAATLGTAAIGCGAAALWLYSDAALGPVNAALVTAGVLLAAALLLLVAARSFIRPRRPQPPAAGGLDLADLARLMTEHKGMFLAAAAILGMLAGSEEQRPNP